jgi:hypothetical protein
MVSQDTVDHDIFEMQQRKLKMSDALMNTGSKNIDWNNKQANKLKSLVLQTALDRFMQSPASSSKHQTLSGRERVESADECDEV